MAWAVVLVCFPRRAWSVTGSRLYCEGHGFRVDRLEVDQAGDLLVWRQRPTPYSHRRETRAHTACGRPVVLVEHLTL